MTKRRAARIALWTAGIILALPLGLIAIVLILANTGPGQRLIESLAARETGGMVVMRHLHGRFPDRLRLGHLELHDAQGAWLRLDDAALDWAPTALVHATLRIGHLRAARLAVARLPVSQPQPATKSSGGSGGFSLPVHVVLQSLHVARAEIGAPIAGADAVLLVDGAADIASLQNGTARIGIQRLDAPGAYALDGTIDPARITARISAQEPEHGLIAGIAKLPALGGPITLQAQLDGPRTAEAVRIAAQAGALQLQAHGLVNLPAQSVSADLSANAPAMAPRADLAWQRIAVSAHGQGGFTTPEIRGTVQIAGLQAGGASMGSLALDLSGDAGHAALNAIIQGLRLPGPRPDLLAAAPVTLQAAAQLDTPDRPVTFAIAHPLIQAHGSARTGGDLQARIDATLPDLQPFAAIGGVDIQGSTHVRAQMQAEGPVTHYGVDGTISITGGMAPLPGLIGEGATLDAAATMNGQDITIDHAALHGKTLQLTASGSDTGAQQALVLDTQIALSDLSAVSHSLAGQLQLVAHAAGQRTDLAVKADLAGALGAPGIPPGPLHAALQATGLPGTPTATLTAQGTLDRAPLRIDARVQRDANGAMQADIARFDWKSADLTANLDLPAGAVIPQGTAHVHLARLADLQPFIGLPIAGAVDADLHSAGNKQADLHLVIDHAGLPSAHIDHATLQARIADPGGKPNVSAQLAVDGIAAAGMTGSAQISAEGPETALALRLAAAVQHLQGADARLNAGATLDIPAQRVALGALNADWHGEALRLLAPARIDFGPAMAVDDLRLGLGDATIALAGTIKPRLDLTASLHNVTPALAKPFAPGLQATGVISAEAKLAGSTAAPTGTVRLTADNLRMLSGDARGLPPVNLRATADLHGQAAQLDAQLEAGPQTRFAITGQAPLSAAGTLALHAGGAVDLNLLNPILTAQGRRVRGRATLDMAIGGTPTKPRPTGTIRLSGGEVQDFTQGAHLTDITASIQADGQQIRIAQFAAKAGPGTITASGSLGVLQPDLPVAITVTARNAQPLASDMLTANIDADLHVNGALKTGLQAGGSVRVNRATINVPDRLPASVAVLDVRQPGQKPPPPPAAAAAIGLDLALAAPGTAIFVRGHGLDAVLGGKLSLTGTSSAPKVAGGFEMQHGTFSLAGTTLTFSRGRVGFDGAGVTGKIDPTLDFEADSTSGGVMAKLLVGGHASAPKITLASDPTLPQDEILAQLLFGTSTQNLGPLQIASIASALATITGVGGGGAGPLDRIRSGLGLDRLSVGTDNGNSIANSIPQLDQRRAATSETSVQAGRYVANGVYVGAKQGTSGTDTQAEVQIDITKRLKVETDLGTGPGANNVGLTYQFRY